MIYLFGKEKDVSVIYDGNTLKEKDKQNAIVVDVLPPKENREGFNAQLCLDKDNNPYWEYYPFVKPTLEELTELEIITKEQYKLLTGKDFVV